MNLLVINSHMNTIILCYCMYGYTNFEKHFIFCLKIKITNGLKPDETPDNQAGSRSSWIHVLLQATSSPSHT